MKRGSGAQIGIRGLLCILLSWICATGCARSPIRALIVTGQNNHNWTVSHPMLRDILEQSTLFTVDIAQTPAQGGDMQRFQPEFSAYEVVILDYNGDRWSPATDSAFLQYINQGGGVVIYHAANNAFADWPEYNRVIALGGWEGRNEQSGPFLYWEHGAWVRDTSAGAAGSHGPQHSYMMHGHNADHPIMRGVPMGWLHASDELYDRMRGPANVQTLLYSAYADPSQGGSGHEVPLIFTVDYGSARIFHLMLGHAGATAEESPALRCIGFQTLLLRGAEWAATGKVRQRVPDDFPSTVKCALR